MSGDHNQYQKPEGCAECGKQASEGWALYCVKCSEPLIDGWPLYSGLPQPEPIGWIYEDDEGRMMFTQMPHPDPLWEPVYKAAPKRKWVGLTDEEIKSLLWETRVNNLTFARVIEKVLREKNAA